MPIAAGSLEPSFRRVYREESEAIELPVESRRV